MTAHVSGLFVPQQAADTSIITLRSVAQTHLAPGRLCDDGDFGLLLGYQPQHPHQVARSSHQLPIQSGSLHSTIRYRLLRNPPTIFIHPKIDSTRLRTLYLGLCVIITSLRRIGVRQTDRTQVIEDRSEAWVAVSLPSWSPYSCQG